jgi:DNA-binding PadR family transcriptional regulator
VYQVLSALEGAGFIVGRSEGRGAKRVFAATPKGRAALRSWLGGAQLRPRAFHDDIFLRLMFVDSGSVEDLLRLVGEQVQIIFEELALLIDQRRETPLRGGFAGVARRLYLEAEVLHREADIRALEIARVALEAVRAGNGVESVFAAVETSLSAPKALEASV